MTVVDSPRFDRSKILGKEIEDMVEFAVNTSSLNQQSRRLSELCDSLVSIQSALQNIGSGLGSIGIGEASASINEIEQHLIKETNYVSACSSTLANVALKYVTAESNIMGVPLLLNPDYLATTATILENSIDGANRAATDGNVFSWLSVFLNGGKASDDDSSETEISYGFSNDEHQSYGTKDRPDLVDSADTMQSISIERTAGVSYWDASGETAGEWGRASGEIGFLNAEASASAYAGFLSEDGKFAPGVGASVGASVSLLEASGDVLLGSDYLGQYYRGEVEVCSASAEASVDIGLYDSDGKFNPSLGAGVEAEAILAQASGSAGYRVMGTDIGVNGSIGFGAGAHADIGLQGGVLKVDVGAYVGVGASVGFELDFSDTYDTMVNAWDATTDFASNAWDTATDIANDAWDATTEFASNAWDVITFWD